MNQELGEQIFNQKMAKLYHEVLSDNASRKIGYFLDNAALGMGPIVKSDEYYFYDLTRIHLENPLGFNHPINLSAQRLPNQSHLISYTQSLIYQIQQVFNDHFKCSYKFYLSDHLNSNHDKKTFLISPSFYRSQDEIQNLKSNIADLKNVTIPIYDNFLLVGSNEVPFTGEKLETLQMYRTDILKEKIDTISLFLKSNLLLSNGKVSLLNEKIKGFCEKYDNLEAGPLKIIIKPNKDYFHETLKANGLLVDVQEQNLNLFFPTTILESELDEVFIILGKLI